jgi:hypothetical protein
MVTSTTTGRGLVWVGTAGAVAIAAHTAVNLAFLRTPGVDGPQANDRVAVLIPARDEASHIEATVRSVLAQQGVPGLSVLVLDDGSTDQTADIVRRVADDDSRLRLIEGGHGAPPPGWLGKPWACARLAEATDADLLCFVDADVIVHPHTVRALASQLRTGAFALVAPYPFQAAVTWLERLVQPLVTWSWVATMPLRWAETSTRPSLSAANGQILFLDAEAYRSIGGHAAVRDNVLEDIGLMRALKSAGFRTVTADGSHLAECRMYDGAGAVVDGYAKSLWAAFGGPAGSLAVAIVLSTCYVAPAVGAVVARNRRTRAVGAIGYAAGVASCASSPGVRASASSPTPSPNRHPSPPSSH